MISYVLEVANYGKEVIRVVCDDIDDCVRLTLLLGVQTTAACRVQMERWDAAALEPISTCTDPRQKSLQLLRMHPLTGYQTTSYPYVIVKLNALKTMVAGDF
jgi:hypothetical protein